MPKLLQESLEKRLASLDGPEWNSSDDEDELEEIKATTKKTKSKKSAKQPRKSSKKQEEKEVDQNTPSSVIYLGHLPPTFTEYELRSFLTQFGEVSKLRLSRSIKTLRPRGYAFVQFVDIEVAAIVAETMSGYFLGKKRLVCHLVPQEKVHEKMFQQKNLQFAKTTTEKNKRNVNANNKTKEHMEKITKKLIDRETKKRDRLKKLGIDYDFPGYAKSAADAATTKTTEKEIEAEPELETETAPVEEKEEPKSSKKRKQSDNDKLKKQRRKKSRLLRLSKKNPNLRKRGIKRRKNKMTKKQLKQMLMVLLLPLLTM
mmetsp:Transcript_37960/g.57786  ORF Transcript_37960/g.57786 Transcript_37960/m.57786 type:complete len:315 (+) Transcript_37960:140-1084(+)